MLNEYLNSEKPEFLAVYGRRRVGKTFLIKEFFNNDLVFYHTGLANSDTEMQLRNFHATIQKQGNAPYPLTNNWFEAFEQLIYLLEHSKKKGKKVVFLDELPWMDTHKSGFITALEHFWNGWASSRPDILLIVCGSATSWMTNKLIKNRGGLHNRITRQMHIRPFTLKECEDFFAINNMVLSRYQIIESYMILGGIPYYLSLMQKKLSLAQNIDALCFAKDAVLKNEFSNLYASLFKHSENHIKIVTALGSKNKGLNREELIRITKLSDGGGFSKTLEELEQCGFIQRYHTFGKTQKKVLYQLIDAYSLFYLNFVRHNPYHDEHFWSNSIDSAKHRAWTGYAFEQVCFWHIDQIKKALGISGVLTQISSWRSHKSDVNAQIDLLIDRNDHVINLCEIKYANGEFTIDKKTEENIRNKKNVFIQETKTRKAVHLTMITTYGIKTNIYSDMIQSAITAEDLFS